MEPGRVEPPPGPVVIIGVGNEYRRDDAVGLVVARLVRGDGERPPGFATVLEESGEGAALLEAWHGAGTVILCDAVHSGAAPGTIHRLDAHRQPIPSAFFHYSTHAFSVAEAIELARALGALPPRLILYGIEGADFTAGLGLSPVVEAAARQVRAAILRLLVAAGAPNDPPTGDSDG